MQYRKIFFLCCIFIFSISFSFSQTNPVAQSLPYAQDFGIDYFSVLPSGFAAWNASTAPCGTLNNAANSSGILDQSVDTAQITKVTPDVYGYSGISAGIPNNDGELYIQTGTGAAGTCQLVLAVNTTGFSSIVVGYDVDMVSPQTRPIGVVFQYRVGTVGAWTTIDQTYAHSIADRAQFQIDNYNLPLPALADNQAVIQLRWATARLAGAGASSGMAIDNILVNGTPAAVTPNYFRSVASGNWNSAATWEWSLDSITWTAATRYPTSLDNSINIRTPNVVSTAGISYLVIDQVTVDAGATLWNAVGTAFGVNDGPTAVDLDINGTFEDSSFTTVVWVNTARWRLGANANFIKASNSGSKIWQWRYYNGIANIPATSNWFCHKPSTAGAFEPTLPSTNGGPPNPQPTYGNLYIENYSATWNTYGNCRFTGSSYAPIVKGNFYVGGSGTGNVSFQIINTNASPVLVNGDVIIKAGSSISNTGTGLEIQGNITNNGSLTYVPSTSKLLFSGGNAQTVSGAGGILAYTLEINKPSNNVTLNQPVLVDGSLSLISGILFTSAVFPFGINDNATSVGASNLSFVSGPMNKFGDDAFTFPVGKNSDYQPIGMSAATAKVPFWGERFNNGCVSGCLANAFVGVNGAWTQTNTGTNDAVANKWFVSGKECGNSPGTCQSACGATDASLHIGSVRTSPIDSGATYETTGAVRTNRRIESPTINCTGKANIIIEFDYLEGGQNASDNGTVWYYNGASWSQFVDLPKTAAGVCTPSVPWVHFRGNLPASSFNNANVKIGFNWTNDSDATGFNPSFAVDDIFLTDESETFNAEYFHTSPQGVYGNTLSPPIDHISNCEYWNLTRVLGASNKIVTLAFDGNSCGVTVLSDLLVARYNGASWVSEGNSFTTGTTSTGTITSNTTSGFGPFTLSSVTTSNPLPISLLHFNAKYNGKDVVLTWTTETEINNNFFTLQRSKNGIQFEDFASVDGAGNSRNTLNYSGKDSKPYPNISYYRLKQTDFDGHYTYSNIVPIDIESKKFEIISIYHSPEHAGIDAVIMFPENGFAEACITDVLGNVVVKETIEVQKQINHIYFDLPALSSGIYFLKIMTNTGIESKRFFYQE